MDFEAQLFSITSGSSVKTILAHLSTTFSRGAVLIKLCLLCVVGHALPKILKHLINHWADLEYTWQKCFLVDPLLNIITELDSIKVLVAMATLRNFLQNIVEVFFSESNG